MTRHTTRLALTLLLGITMPLTAWAQDKAPPQFDTPSPAEKTPLSTTTDPNPTRGGGTPAPRPDKSLAPALPSGAAPAGSVKPPALHTLVPMPAEPGDVEEVTLPPKPAAILAGKAGKDEAASVLADSFRRINEALDKAGIRPTGRPIAVFTNVGDDVLEFDAMVPVQAVPGQVSAGLDGLRFGTTPAGKGFRFRHLGAYDEISGTYEVFSTYLDLKEVTVRDEFVEEFVNDLKDGSDAALDVNIYALRK